jgi:AAHS family 4-hydroxybenzoate transporter-like MFS transporter
MAAILDVARWIDERKVSAFTIRLVILGFFVTLFDGYDIAAASFAGPSLVKAWHIAPGALGPMFSASLIGMLFGAPLLGWIGDRHGRRLAIILSCLIFGGFTWLAAMSTGLGMLTLLRFLAGIGIGGLMPNMIALTAEYAPRSYRATLVILMFTGVSFGGSFPGLIAARLVPHYGWQALFVVGGVVPLLVALLCFFALPESIKYLVVKGNRTGDVRRLLQQIDPGSPPPADATFVIRDERQYSGFSPRYLFSDGLQWITPLLWLLFVINLMVYFFLLSWTPILLTSAALPLSMAALATSIFQIGGTIGGLVLCRPMDTRGLTPIAILFALAVPVVASIGYLGLIAPPLLLLFEFLGGFCVLGLQFGLNALAGMVYPTSVRSNGAGWALGVGRVGSIVGPLVGGALIAAHLRPQQLYLFAAIPLVIGTIACYALSRLYQTRFHGRAIAQRDLSDVAPVSMSP